MALNFKPMDFEDARIQGFKECSKDSNRRLDSDRLVSEFQAWYESKFGLSGYAEHHEFFLSNPNLSLSSMKMRVLNSKGL